MHCQADRSRSIDADAVQAGVVLSRGRPPEIVILIAESALSLSSGLRARAGSPGSSAGQDPRPNAR